MSDLDEPVVVVVPGDLHLIEPHRDNVGVARRVVDQVNALIRPGFRSRRAGGDRRDPLVLPHGSGENREPIGCFAVVVSRPTIFV
jgi:hypothetical protein